MTCLESALASLIIFLSFSCFMFAAGYQWRKLDESRVPTRSDDRAAPRETAWDGMLGKL